jgi:hypothetical protein
MIITPGPFLLIEPGEDALGHCLLGERQLFRLTAVAPPDAIGLGLVRDLGHELGHMPVGDGLLA